MTAVQPIGSLGKNDFFNMSGAALNTSRRTTSPIPLSDLHRDVTGHATQLHIDLYNFEEPRYEDSKFVLTSPRSLNACSRMGLKPVELLYKSLAEFQEELQSQDVPLRTIYNMYDQQEHDRQKTLKLCREERQKIIEGENNVEYTAPRIKIWDSRAKEILSKPSLRERFGNTDGASGDTDSSSLQRERTAWATSVGHKRVSKDELNQRTKKLHDESMKLRRELLSKKERMAKKPRAAQKKKKSQTSQSLINLSKNGSTFNLMGQSVLSQAKPITSTTVRSKLKGSSSLHSLITPRDEKILDLMIKKAESEKSDKERRMSTKLAWEEERKQEMEARTVEENKRRELLNEENRIKEQRRLAKESILQKEEEQGREMLEKKINVSQQQWEVQSLKQQRIRAEALASKIDKESLRKRSQEQNLLAQQEDEERFQKLVEQNIEHELMRSSLQKEEKIQREIAIFKSLQEARKKKNRSNLNHVESETLEGFENLRTSIDRKHNHAEAKYEEIVQRRNRDIAINQYEKQKKHEKTRKTQKRLEAEMDVWRESLNDHRRVVDDRAREMVQRGFDTKAHSAFMSRLAKEQSQKQNIKQIHEEVETWRQETKASIDQKDRKTRSLMQEREMTIDQTRSLARSAEILRDEIRERYAIDTFDKKAHRAQLIANLGHSAYSSTKNASTINIA